LGWFALPNRTHFLSCDGMPSLGGGKEFEVKVTSPYSFELVGADTSSEGPYTTGGYVNQVKV